MNNITTDIRSGWTGRIQPALWTAVIATFMCVTSVRAGQPTTAPADAVASARALLVVGMPARGGEAAWKREVANQLVLVASPAIMRAAVDSVRRSDWFQTFDGDVDRATETLSRSVTVRLIPDSSLIEVRASVPTQDAVMLRRPRHGLSWLPSGVRKGLHRVAKASRG